MQDLKMQDTKMVDQMAGHENARPENETSSSWCAEHSDCRKSKQLTGRRLLDPEDNAWNVTLISVN